MTTPILLQNSESLYPEQSEDVQIQPIEPFCFEEDNETPPLKNLLNLCRQNISKKILEEKQTETAPFLFSDLALFLEESESDLDPDKPPTSKKKKPQDPLSIISEVPVPFLRPFLEFPLMQPSPLTSISEASLLLFDKMCSEMLVMTSESCSKTTLTLQTEEFAHSPFYGAEITLEEFSTAPKIFNVSIKANDSAITLIQSHLAGFMQLLEERNFSFGINRIDTSILTKSSLSKKKQDKFSPLSEDPKDERTP